MSVEVDGHAFGCGYGIGEYGAGFGKVSALVVVALGVVAYDELLRSGFEGYAGGFGSGRVAALRCFVGLVVGVGSFVVYGVDAAHGFGYARIVGRVGAVGIAACRLGGGGQPFVGHDGAVGHHEVGALLDGEHLRHGHAVEVDHLAVDVAQLGFFAEYEAGAGHAVVEGEGLDGERLVLVYYALLGLYDVEAEVVGAFAAEEVEDALKQLCALGKGVDGDGAFDVVESHRGEQSGQSEAVIAVKMRYEYVVQSAVFQLHATHGELCALAAVNHHQFIAVVNDLT